MADATYTTGTNEYVVVELERNALSSAFDDTDWTYKLALLPQGEDFTNATADWQTASYELVTDAQGETHYTVKCLLQTLTTNEGVFLPYVRLTASGAEVETPTILRAAGLVTFK